MKIDELIKAIRIQIPEAIKGVSSLGPTDRPNSWTFEIINSSGEKQVLKVIKPTKREEADGQSEEEALAKIKKRKDVRAIHYISKTRIVLKNEEFPAFLFPFIDGPDLDKLIQKGTTTTEDEVLKFLDQITITILKLAEEGIVHQDVKPGNIKVTNDGSYILLDLGIARFIDYGYKILKQQGPAKYLSPEQVALGQEATDFNKRRITFLSDIYSAGVIAVELLSGKSFSQVWKTDRRHLVSDELKKGTFSLSIKSDLLRSRLANYLNTSPDIRLKYLHVHNPSSLRFIYDKKIGMPLFWNLHHSVTGINLLSEFAQENVGVRGGGLLLAETVRSVENGQKIAQDLQTKGWKIAVDPSTYKLVYHQDHHAYLKDRDYIRPGLTSMSFAKPEFTHTFVSDVMSFQDLYNPDFYISPYFFVEDPKSNYLDLNFTLHEVAIQVLGTKATDHPLLFGIAISSELLKDQYKTNEILNQLLLYPKAQGYYIRCELLKTMNAPCADEEYLRGLLRFVNTLAISKTVLLSQVDQSILGVLANTRLSFAINPDPAARKADVDSKLSSPQRHGGGPKKEDKRIGYYLPPILNDLDLHREFYSTIKPKLGAGLDCTCKYCRKNPAGLDMREQNRHKHFLLNFYEQARSITQKDGSERKAVFTKIVSDAEIVYKKLNDSGIRLSDESKGAFLATWRKIFCTE